MIEKKKRDVDRAYFSSVRYLGKLLCMWILLIQNTKPHEIVIRSGKINILCENICIRKMFVCVGTKFLEENHFNLMLSTFKRF